VTTALDIGVALYLSIGACVAVGWLDERYSTPQKIVGAPLLVIFWLPGYVARLVNNH